MSVFQTPIQCVGVAHRLTAGPGSGTGGTAYADAVPGSSWRLSAVAAAPGAPTSVYEGAPLLFGNSTVPGTQDVFNSGQNCWVLHDASGLALSPGSTSYSFGAARRGFSVALWFRVDDAGASNPTTNAVLQLTLTGGVTLTLTSKYSTVATVALSATAASASAVDYAVSTDATTFGSTAASQPNGGAFSVGSWQHVAFSFDASGNQTGLFWNGKQQLGYHGAHSGPITLAPMFGSPPPYGPLVSGSLGYDVARVMGGAVYPLWGAIGDVQVYDFAMSEAMAVGLFTGASSQCIAAPPPPAPPPSRFVSPPPSPPLSISYCVAGYSTVSILQYNTSLVSGTGAFLGVLPSYITFVNISVGCDTTVAAAGRRHLLLNPLPPPPANCSNISLVVCGNATAPNVTVANSTTVTVTMSLSAVVASNAPALAQLRALANSSNATGATSLAVSLQHAGMASVTGVALTAASTAALSAHANTSLALLQQTVSQLNNHTQFQAVAAKAQALTHGAAAAVGAAVALAGLAVLWVAVHTIVHAVTTYHVRRTTVTAALLVRCTTAAELLSATAAELAEEAGQGNPEGGPPLPKMLGKRFKAPGAVAVLTPLLMTAAAAAVPGAVAARVALRPLNRGPLLAARGAATSGHGAHDASGLALKTKPQGLWRRLKRAVMTELRWQSREMRQVARAVRRCCSSTSRSHDDVGRVFRLVNTHTAAVRAAAASSSPAAAQAAALSQGMTACLVEVTWSFGVGGRDAACAWRAALRSEELCAQLEAGISGALAAANSELLACGFVAVALLDDAPHAALDKKRAQHVPGAASPADDKAAAQDADGRSTGLAAAVASRLGAVLLVSLREDGELPGAGRWSTASASSVQAPEKEKPHIGEQIMAVAEVAEAV